MKGCPYRRAAEPAAQLFLSLGLVLAAAAGARAQEMVAGAQDTTQVTATAEPEKEPEGAAMQRRMARARSLAAVGKLAAAASDLEAMRASSKDESVREVARILLMAIYVEMPDYARATGLLEETFKARAAQDEAARRAYYTLAGQTVNSVRVHVERYRTFGIDVADGGLPTEADGDLGQLRLLLEQVVSHARAIREDEDKAAQGAGGARDNAATALLEDAASVRLRLARTPNERGQWQREVSEARQRLFASETRIASISELPLARPAGATSTAPPTTPPAPGAQPAGQGSAARSQPPSNVRAANASENRSAEAAPAQSAPAANGEARAAKGGPVAVGALITKATQRHAPSYPPIAKSARVTGVVVVFVVVNEKGEVESVERADGPLQLQQAASEAARRWKFRPTVVDGQPVRVTGYLSFSFTL